MPRHERHCIWLGEKYVLIYQGLERPELVRKYEGMLQIPLVQNMLDKGPFVSSLVFIENRRERCYLGGAGGIFFDDVGGSAGDRCRVHSAA